MPTHSSAGPLLILVALTVSPALAPSPPASSLETAPAGIEQYLAIRTATVAGLSPDAKSVAFLTNTTGSNQIWTIPADGGWPDQITFFSDRVSSVSWSPRGDWIAFSKDSGGDENNQLYLVSPDGSKLVRLTDAPAVRHNFGGWSRDGRWISYSSNARNKKYFDVYMLNVDTGDRKLLHEADALFSAGPFSNDGATIILVRANASLDNDLFVLPLAEDADGRRRSPLHLTLHEGRAQYNPVGWSADDKTLWIVSDAAREFSALARVQIPSGTLTWALEPPWDVQSAALSRDGKVIAVEVNEDGYDTVTVRDTATLEPRSKVTIPKGSASALRISNDSSTLALTLGGAGRNPDVWLVNLDTGRLGQVTRSSTAGILPSTFVEPRLVRYKTFDDRQIPAFLYLPAADARSGKPPCLVMPH